MEILVVDLLMVKCALIFVIRVCYSASGIHSSTGVIKKKDRIISGTILHLKIVIDWVAERTVPAYASAL